MQAPGNHAQLWQLFIHATIQGSHEKASFFLHNQLTQITLQTFGLLLQQFIEYKVILKVNPNSKLFSNE